MNDETSEPSGNEAEQQRERDAAFHAESLLRRAREQDIYFAPLPDMTDGRNPKPKSTLANFAEILNRLNWKIQYNTIQKTIIYDIPALNGKRIDNRDNSAFAHIVSEMAKFDMPTGNATDFILSIANENPFNPVTRWILSAPWDGTERLTAFLNTITVDENEMRPNFKNILILKWMISGLYALVNDNVGYSAHGVLVFQGKQGIGKTFWFKRLVGENREWVQDGVTLDMQNKDSVTTAVSHWMVELGELDSTFRKSDIAQLKSFITQQTDIIRRPYARNPSVYPRTTIFFASVNDKQFLNDDTGNRRFWTLPVTHIDYKTNFDMQQIWAEVYATAYSKFNPNLESHEMTELSASNEQFEPDDPIVGLLQSQLVWTADKSTWRWLNTSTLLTEILHRTPTRLEVKKANALFAKMPEIVETRVSRGHKQHNVPQCLAVQHRVFD